MDIDLPEVVAEVREAFERYEQALVTNDVATLDSLFRQDERTIRYGIAENLYGHEEVAAFRGGPPAGRPDAHALAHGDHHLRPGLRRRLHALPPPDAWPARSAGRCRAGCASRTGWRVVAAHVSIIDAPKA